MSANGNINNRQSNNYSIGNDGNDDNDDGNKSTSTSTSAAAATTNNNLNHNGTIMAKAKARGLDLLAYSQRRVDRIVNPATRQRAIDSVTAFASKRPLLSLFITAQLLLSLLPLLLFGGFVLSTIVLATVTALAFVLFWTGLALLFLVPTLFFTAGLALLLWVWAVGTYVTFRAFYSRLPASIRGPAGSDDKHVIFPHKEGGFASGTTRFRPTSASAPAHDFDFDDAIAAEAAEVRE
ncbi:hypothetical protein F5Y10DRAFT_223202 [Nemania abortiva]|nr:hypothetical protein F5Y10DRAFT_223202 [Nemania abortiva]